MQNSPNKKILFFTRPLAPPWDEASKNLAFEIAKNASGFFDFYLLTTKKNSSDLIENCENSSPKRIFTKEIYHNTSFGRSEKIALLKALFSLKNELDLLHFLFTPRKLTSLLIRTKLQTLKAKTIQTIATINEELYQNKKLLRKTLFADKIVAQSTFTQQRLLNLGMKNIEMIYPGIDLEKFSPRPKDLEFMKKMGISQDEFVVLYAGEYDRLDAMDNVFGAIDLALKNKPQSLRIKFVMACRIKNKKDKTIKQEFIEKTAKLGYDRHIVFVDFCHEMTKLYNMADVQIFPVRKMSGKFDIPFVLIEQMACGKPLIVSDLDVLKEFVKDQETGFVVRKDSPSAFGKAILEISQDQELLSKLGKNSLNYVRESFNIKQNIKEYEKLYSSVINN